MRSVESRSNPNRRGFWTRERRSEAIDKPVELFYALTLFGALFVINFWLGLIVTVTCLGIFLAARAQRERAQRRREVERPELANHRPHPFRLWRDPRR